MTYGQRYKRRYMKCFYAWVVVYALIGLGQGFDLLTLAITALLMGALLAIPTALIAALFHSRKQAPVQ